ncbi:hypothetical protein [Paludisphaera rhizosphaerae]|uniref:hypothetical protein n=1 Tax=Paludisphaera rhizosphaerae TaxID=2711216 RepID=UPI0013ED7709|nr:hypothetical protein [Paludisphaera rhizosphaerae]
MASSHKVPGGKQICANLDAATLEGLDLYQASNPGPGGRSGAIRRLVATWLEAKRAVDEAEAVLAVDNNAR